MATFIMQTRLSHQALQAPESLAKLSREVMQQIRAHCPAVDWKASYAILGPADYIDIFEAPDIATATKVATIIRTFGHATTEIWAATEWKKFMGLMGEFQGEPAKVTRLRERRPQRRNGEKAAPARKRG